MSAQSGRTIVAGLGQYRGAVDVTVRWTDGVVEQRRSLSAGRVHTIVRAPPPPASEHEPDTDRVLPRPSTAIPVPQESR
jgi:hypothetical protein